LNFVQRVEHHVLNPDRWPDIRRAERTFSPKESPGTRNVRFTPKADIIGFMSSERSHQRAAKSAAYPTKTAWPFIRSPQCDF
jgi:hypothetical protein